MTPTIMLNLFMCDAFQEGAIQLIKPLSKDTQELVRLDLSNCALTHEYIASLKDEASLVCGILELNLGGNPIRKEVCICFIGCLAWVYIKLWGISLIIDRRLH